MGLSFYSLPPSPPRSVLSFKPFLVGDSSLVVLLLFYASSSPLSTHPLRSHWSWMGSRWDPYFDDPSVTIDLVSPKV